MKRKLITRGICIFLLMTMLLGTLTACGEKSTGVKKKDDDKITLTVTVSHTELGNYDIYQKYMDEHPNIIIEEIPVSNSDTKLLSMIASGNPPDIIRFAAYDELPVFVQRGLMLPLDEYVEKSENINLDNMYDVMQLCRYDGTTRGKGSLYGLPKDWSPTGIWINKDVFKEEGIPLPSATKPMTWDEYAQLAQRLVKKDGDAVDRHGSISSLPLPTLLEMYLCSYGQSMWNEDYSSTTLETAETKKAVKFFQQLQETAAFASNLYPASDYIGISSLLEDKVGMVLGGYWFRGGWGSAGANLKKAAEKLMFVPGPVGTNGSCYILDQVCAGVFAESEHPDEAYDLLEYIMLAEESVTARTKVGLGLPAEKTYIDTLPRETEFDKQLLETVNVQMNTLDLSPKVCPYITYRSLTTLFDKYYLPVLYDRSTLDEAMKLINKEVEILIQETKDLGGVN